jgi:TPR repeat protein
MSDFDQYFRKHSESFNAALAGEPDVPALWEAVSALANAPHNGLARLTVLASKGSKLSMIYLGDSFERGQIVTKDLGEADSWYQRAADLGSTEGAHRLAGSAWHDGHVDQAIHQLQLLSQSGFIPATYCLGEIYYFGEKILPNQEKAIHFFKLADKNGHFLAKQMLSFLYRNNIRSLKFSIKGWMKMINLAIVGAWYKFSFPSSDRFRSW